EGELFIERLPEKPHFGHGGAATGLNRFVAAGRREFERIETRNPIIAGEDGDVDFSESSVTLAAAGSRKRLEESGGQAGERDGIDRGAQSLMDKFSAQSKGHRTGRKFQEARGPNDFAVEAPQIGGAL